MPDALLDDRPPAAPPAEAEPVHARTRAPRALVALVLAVAVALAGVIAGVAASSGGTDVHEVVVPAGTGSALEAGDDADVVGRTIRLEPGDALEVTNDDSRLHVVGALRVDPGETARQVFGTEGRYVVATSLRRDALLTILVVRG